MAPVLILRIASSNLECAYRWDFMNSAKEKKNNINRSENLIRWIKIEALSIGDACEFLFFPLLSNCCGSNYFVLSPLR